jgi:uncharacterized protein (DUF362 family)
MIVGKLATIAAALSFTIPSGSRVLLKPNLVSGRGHSGLACTHPEFVAAAAQWCVDCGAKVSIGDSPAFGRAPAVMAQCGIAERVKDLPVKLVHFKAGLPVQLAGGEKVVIAAESLDCDLLINLPRFKAHSQTLVTLAVKNYFGTVKGFAKARLHQKLGKDENAFCRMLVDLLAVLPSGVSFMDGIEAMHQSGPMDGVAFPLGIVAGSLNPVALDTAMLMTLGVSPGASMVWRETARRKYAGAEEQDLVFPLLYPVDFRPRGFLLPEGLKPIPFHPRQVVSSQVRRLRLLLSS